MPYPKISKSYSEGKDEMSAAAASEYMRKMIAREMKGPNDLGPSMNRIEQKFGIPFWTQDHLRKGKAKTCDASLFARVRNAYLSHCERQLKSLQHEIEVERAKGHDLDQDILAEVEALLAKVEARKKC